jgi:hypothetical protein
MIRGARGRIAESFDRTIASADAALRGRLLDFAEARRSGRATSVEEAWGRSMGDRPRPGLSPAATVVAADGELVVRVERRGDETVTARGLATLAVAGVAGLAWSLARRRPVWWSHAAVWLVRLAPLAVLAAGAAWVLLLTPTLPGWICLLTGGLRLRAIWNRAATPAPTPGGLPARFVAGRMDDTTRTFVAG